jgi:hypothetical protein
MDTEVGLVRVVVGVFMGWRMTLCRRRLKMSRMIEVCPEGYIAEPSSDITINRGYKVSSDIQRYPKLSEAFLIRKKYVKITYRGG